MFWRKKLTNKATTKLINKTNNKKTIKYSKIKTIKKLLENIKIELDKIDNNDNNDNTKSKKLLLVLSCKIPVNKLKGKVFIKDKDYLAWIAIRSNDTNTIKSLYKYTLSKNRGIKSKLDYEMNIYKLDDARIQEINNKQFNKDNKIAYSEVMNFINNNNLELLKKIDMKIAYFKGNDFTLELIDRLLIHY